MARYVKVALACCLLFAAGCGAFQFSIPAGAGFATAAGPALPPTSSDVNGGFPLSAQFPTAPNPGAIFFPVINPPGFNVVYGF